MPHGLDTSFLVAAEVAGHVEHTAARARLKELRQASDRFALTPQVLAEFIHVVTDGKRFRQPLPMAAALARSNVWWKSPEVVQLWPDEETVRLFFSWMTAHRLGRTRVLDTLLAAAYRNAGITSLLTTKARDFTVFGEFTCIAPLSR